MLAGETMTDFIDPIAIPEPVPNGLPVVTSGPPAATTSMRVSDVPLTDTSVLNAQPLLHISDVCLHYGEKQALFNINLEVREHSVMALIGTGCGLPSTLRSNLPRWSTGPACSPWCSRAWDWTEPKARCWLSNTEEPWWPSMPQPAWFTGCRAP